MTDAVLTAELSALLADIIQKKPTTKADALALLETLEVRLTTWLISDLPVLEQKAILATQWAVEEVASGKCC